MCCFYSGVLLVLRFISCNSSARMCSVSGWQPVLCILNFIEAIIFGLFVCIMMWDQLSAILSNTPGIDAKQNKKGEQREWYISLCEVFGEEFSWRWFFPLNMPARVRDDFEQLCVYDPELGEALGLEDFMASYRPEIEKANLNENSNRGTAQDLRAVMASAAPGQNVSEKGVHNAQVKKDKSS